MSGPLFEKSETEGRLHAMRAAIAEVANAMQTLGKGSPWSPDAKVSDDFLTPLFKVYYTKLAPPNLMEKKDFYELARFIPEDEIDGEVCDKLAAISETSKDAN